MKLTDLKNEVEKFVGRMKKGKKLKSTQVKNVLDKLERKEKKIKREYAHEISAKDGSAKEIKRLELQKKVLKAQKKKAHKLLKDLDS
ncbi:hypothetical protein N9H39_11925 [Gammaproteobacteria bacterium]|nr:hypothetical protein [Gammaproteobacteria bacterium]